MRFGQVKDILTQNTGKATLAVKKNSPLILTGLGIVGLGATAYLAYKSRGKVDAVVTSMENGDYNKDVGDDDEGKPIYKLDKVQFGTDLAKAVAVPVATGVVSVCSIALSYYIMNNRIVGLAAALASAKAEQEYFETKYRDENGDAAWEKFSNPVEQTGEEVTLNEDGEDKKIKVGKKDRKSDIYGAWFNESTEYAADDHAYNKRFIEATADKMANKLFRNGYLLLNDVKDELGLERDRAGALVGWTTGDSFFVETTTNMLDDGEDIHPELYIKWSKPRYIYDSMSFEK